MKGTRHSEEQIITILKQGEAGLATASCVGSTASWSRPITAGKRSTVGWTAEKPRTEAALIGASSISRHQGSRLRGIPTFVHGANTNRLASLYADQKFANLAAPFPANADPGLARLVLDQAVNRSAAAALPAEYPGACSSPVPSWAWRVRGEAQYF